MSFDSLIYPALANKAKEFDAITKIRRQGERFSFYKKGLKRGQTIYFVADHTITAKIASER